MFFNKRILYFFIALTPCAHGTTKQLLSEKIKILPSFVLGPITNGAKQKLWKKENKINKAQLLRSSLIAGSTTSIVNDIGIYLQCSKKIKKIAEKHFVATNVLIPSVIGTITANCLDTSTVSSVLLPVTAIITGFVNWYYFQSNNKEQNESINKNEDSIKTKSHCNMAKKLGGNIERQDKYLKSKECMQHYEEFINKKNKLYRPCVFIDLMEKTETEFQKSIGYKYGQPVSYETIMKHVPKKNKKFFPQKNNFKQISLKNLRVEFTKKYNSKNQPKEYTFSNNGKHNNQTTLEKLDIRYNQGFYASEEQADTVFMICSNWNGLEEFMGDKGTHLQQMQYGAVQGEEAAMATMGATIIRKYCHPKTNFLDKLSNKITTNNGRIETISQKLTDNDIENIEFGFHANVPITSGYANPNFNSNNLKNNRIKELEGYNFISKDKKTVNVYNGLHINNNNLDELYDENYINLKNNPALYIDQAFVAPLNLNKNHNLTYDSQQQQETAKKIITAAYESTILWAYINNKKRVVLSFLGCGAFKNNKQWVYDALLKNKNIHKAIVYGDLKVELVYYNKINLITKKESNDRNEFEKNINKKLKEVHQKNNKKQLDIQNLNNKNQKNKINTFDKKFHQKPNYTQDEKTPKDSIEDVSPEKASTTCTTEAQNTNEKTTQLAYSDDDSSNSDSDDKEDFNQKIKNLKRRASVITQPKHQQNDNKNHNITPIYTNQYPDSTKEYNYSSSDSDDDWSSEESDDNNKTN